jgi:hypothetical protein
MFRDVYADRFELRVRVTEIRMWEWELWDLRERRLLETSARRPDGRYHSSLEAYRAGREHAAAFTPVVR